MFEIKMEHDMCKKGQPNQLGLMVEITAPAAPQIQSAPRKPQALVFVIDRSGSMGGGRLEMVKQTLLDTLPRLHAEDYFSVVTFDDTPVTEVAMRRVSEQDLRSVQARIGALETGGSTNLEGGYFMGLQQASRAPRGMEVNLILLSDGHANVGNRNPETLGKAAGNAIEHLVTTSTIGVGDGYDEALLAALAGNGNGNHIAALERAEVLEGLHAVINDLLQKTMTDVRIQIDFAQNYNGPKARIRSARQLRRFDSRFGRADALVGDLSSEEQKNVLFDLILDPHPLVRPGLDQAFTVTVSYTDVFTANQISETHDMHLNVVEPSEWQEPKRNDDITVELHALRMQVVRDRAMKLYNNGRVAEADAILAEAGMQLQDMLAAAGMLSDRNRMRAMAQADELSSYMSIDDVNAKRKRLYEAQNRVNRDRRDFRTKP